LSLLVTCRLEGGDIAADQSRLQENRRRDKFTTVEVVPGGSILKPFGSRPGSARGWLALEGCF
jgi:hypothetical protein